MCGDFGLVWFGLGGCLVEWVMIGLVCGFVLRVFLGLGLWIVFVLFGVVWLVHLLLRLFDMLITRCWWVCLVVDGLGFGDCIGWGCFVLMVGFVTCGVDVF